MIVYCFSGILYRVSVFTNSNVFELVFFLYNQLLNFCFQCPCLLTKTSGPAKLFIFASSVNRVVSIQQLFIVFCLGLEEPVFAESKTIVSADRNVMKIDGQ